MTARALAGLLLLTVCGCNVRPPVAMPAPPPREGRTSVRLLTAEKAGSGSSGAADEIVTPAWASAENQLPRYPAPALSAGCRDGAVPVRVHVGTDGNVAAIRDVPGRPAATDDCHLAFQAAVKEAVAAWRFAPAFRQTPTPGPDVDGDGRPDLTRWEQVAVPIYLDFEFLFTVVDGRGEVRSR